MLRTEGGWLKSWRQIVKKSVDSHRIRRYYAEMVSLVGINEEEA